MGDHTKPLPTPLSSPRKGLYAARCTPTVPSRAVPRSLEPREQAVGLAGADAGHRQQPSTLVHLQRVEQTGWGNCAIHSGG
eukprot:scaffold17806_cov90-Isochrysis_galbana.AAC.2